MTDSMSPHGRPNRDCPPYRTAATRAVDRLVLAAAAGSLALAFMTQMHLTGAAMREASLAGQTDPGPAR